MRLSIDFVALNVMRPRIIVKLDLSISRSIVYKLYKCCFN